MKLLTVLGIVVMVFSCVNAWRSKHFLSRSFRLFSTKSFEKSSLETSQQIVEENFLHSFLLESPPLFLEEVEDENFECKVLQQPSLSIVYFTASWCKTPMQDTIMKVKNERAADPINFYTLDTDENCETTSEYNIRFLPSLGLFKNGKMVTEIVGNVPSTIINQQIEKYLKVNHSLMDYDIAVEDPLSYEGFQA
jgi:thioredoxin 1